MRHFKWGVVVILIFLVCPVRGQIKLPVKFTTIHPRMAESADSKVIEGYKNDVDTYVTRHGSDSAWMVSRLQMYWKTKSTDVMIKGGVYDHAAGEAPVPTVRFPGARDNVTIYGNLKLEDLQPYMDDPRGIPMINRSKPGQPVEWADIAKTGRNIEAINTSIMRLAAEAGSLYRLSNQEKYARFAFDLFDTYMSGMYYRKEPSDLSRGHHQTITGLSTFEVIQEVAMLGHLTSVYDNLFGYIQKHAPQKNRIYIETFKKWADLQIKNGVAFNNWNLMQAKNVLMIANVLERDSSYSDRKGIQFYMDQILNRNSERQWSVVKIMNEGYDSTGIWNESAGYSSGVLHDFASYVNWFDDNFNYDLLPQLPILEKAALAEAQYMFPNGYTTAFGDSYYRQLDTQSAMQLLKNAEKNNKTAQQERFTRFIKTIDKHKVRSNPGYNPVGAHLKTGIRAGQIEDYVSPVFSSPKVSYFAQRNGMDTENGLMVAMAGSKGNHMHANGISMEIYGKGLILGPDGGIGTSYFQQDYAEYYSQFPAHNTVAVDGISAYPVMKSNHAFTVLGAYPRSDQKTGYFPPVTFGELYFLEPETQSDQNRLTSIIRTGDSTGYYVDIFRSKRKDGKDKMHDYFYHNLGGALTLTNTAGKPLDLVPTEKLSFAGGHLFAYDYFHDKKAVNGNQDFNAAFAVNIPGRDQVRMNLWMKGEAGREIFAVKAPRSKAFRNDEMIPDSVAQLPLSAIIARQSGEAWSKPFVAVYEPSAGKVPTAVGSITSLDPAGASGDFVGLKIENKIGSTEFVFSSPAGEAVSFDGRGAEGVYAVISENKDGLHYLFLGKGKSVGNKEYSIASSVVTSAALYNKNGKWFFFGDQPLKLTMPDTYADSKKVFLTFSRAGKKASVQGTRLAGKAQVEFILPAIPYQPITIDH